MPAELTPDKIDRIEAYARDRGSHYEDSLALCAAVRALTQERDRLATTLDKVHRGQLVAAPVTITGAENLHDQERVLLERAEQAEAERDAARAALREIARPAWLISDDQLADPMSILWQIWDVARAALGEGDT